MYAHGPASQSLPMATELVARQLVIQLLCRSSRYIASQTQLFYDYKTIILPSSGSILCAVLPRAVFCTRASSRASVSTLYDSRKHSWANPKMKYDYLQQGSHGLIIYIIRMPPNMHIQYGGSITNQYEFNDACHHDRFTLFKSSYLTAIQLVCYILTNGEK